MASPVVVVRRLADATSEHDLDGIVACFAEDYVNETPVHPSRGFQGRDQVRRNWEQILTAVPDIAAYIDRSSVDDDTVWSEWHMSGTRRDGALHEMRGVIIFDIAGGLITSARFYLEPVENRSETADEALQHMLTAQHTPGSAS